MYVCIACNRQYKIKITKISKHNTNQVSPFRAVAYYLSILRCNAFSYISATLRRNEAGFITVNEVLLESNSITKSFVIRSRTLILNSFSVSVRMVCEWCSGTDFRKRPSRALYERTISSTGMSSWFQMPKQSLNRLAMSMVSSLSKVSASIWKLEIRSTPNSFSY